MADTEGAIYISASGAYYAPSDVDAGTLAEVLASGYIREQLDKSASKIYNGMYSLRVLDADDEEVPELSKRVRDMVEAPGVLLWSRMKQAWIDIFAWGACILYPKWVRRGGEVVLTELRRLPPESFAVAPLDTGAEAIHAHLLPGIVLENGKLVFYQSQGRTHAPVRLREGVRLFKDSASTELAGTSKALSLAPIIKMIDFCWDAQMQKVNRVGAPIMFIKLATPYNDGDVAYAQTILNNWGKGRSYQLRPNMELVALDVQDNEHALTTISQLEKRVEAPFRPGSSLDKEGATIGGNATAQKEAEDDWILGQRTMIEDLFEGLVEEYLERNGYVDHAIELRIAVRTAMPGDLELRQAQLGWQARALSINEVRVRLGAVEMSEDELATIAAEWDTITTQQSDPLFGDLSFSEVKERAEVLRAVTDLDQMDPERYIPHDDQLRFLGRKE